MATHLPFEKIRTPATLKSVPYRVAGRVHFRIVSVLGVTIVVKPGRTRAGAVKVNGDAVRGSVSR